MNIKEIIPNPNNPRIIKDAKFKKLVKSLKDFPKMMELRPIVLDENNMIQGGNMRFKALIELGYKELPDEWIKKGNDFTKEQWEEFVIKDNISFGENDWEMLANNYDIDVLEDFGLEVPNVTKGETKIKEIQLQPYERTHVLLSFPPEKMIDLQPLLQQIVAYSFVEYEQSNN